ncbi:MAG: DUF542 domain-containing protein, partial [Flavobacteriaceae bacterium]|nr:DUF542 domain-containing protein [Flavobacteriaceae bacterium]
MTITENQTVSEIVTQNIKASHVFKRHGIDFCCGGNVSLKEVCRKKGIDYNNLSAQLQCFDLSVDKESDFANMEPGELINHIVKVHHSYVLENIPIIIQYVQKVAKVHGHYYPRLHQIKNLFIEVSQELEEHLTKEETVLFPFIEEMLNEKESGSLQSDLSTEDIKECISMLEEEHERAGNIFKDISILSNNYTPPVDACNT